MSVRRYTATDTDKQKVCSIQDVDETNDGHIFMISKGMLIDIFKEAKI